MLLLRDEMISEYLKSVWNFLENILSMQLPFSMAAI